MHFPIFVMVDSLEDDNHVTNCATDVTQVEMLNWTGTSIMQTSVNDGHRFYDAV